jgi:FkbH-like protein
MKYYIYRNHTVEHLFKGESVAYSHYGDISLPATPNDYTVFVWFYMVIPASDVGQLVSEIEAWYNRIEWLRINTPTQPFIVFLLTPQLTSTWYTSDRRVFDAIQRFNQRIIELSQTTPLVKYLDTSHFTMQFSTEDIFDWKFFYISDMVINPKLAKRFQIWWTAQIRALSNQRKKCLVLDMDNTLWGGILGEDGISGIKLGDTYPGRAYKQFQEYLLAASQHGVILAACSKNNETDVVEAWETHPAMVLRQQHFAAYRINWTNKATNIREIAEELNIGLDSLVFIDDNPAEREIIKQVLPEVIVPDFPDHPYNLVNNFIHIYDQYFTSFSLSKEDLAKTSQYLENTQRKIHQQQFFDFEDYLGSLEMRLTVYPANVMNLTRIAQMTQKTNQFNLTTRRYSESDLAQRLQNSSMIQCLGVLDKFGDNGITVAVIIDIDAKTAHFDSYLLSCRILGRGIERAFIHYLLNQLLSQQVNKVTATYIPTAKNKQTEQFYESVGFVLTDIDKNGSKWYSMDLTTPFDVPSYYNFVNK